MWFLTHYPISRWRIRGPLPWPNLKLVALDYTVYLHVTANLQLSFLLQVDIDSSTYTLITHMTWLFSATKWAKMREKNKCCVLLKGTLYLTIMVMVKYRIPFPERSSSAKLDKGKSEALKKHNHNNLSMIFQPVPATTVPDYNHHSTHREAALMYPSNVTFFVCCHK